MRENLSYVITSTVVQSLSGPFTIKDRFAEDLAAAAPLPTHRFDPCAIKPTAAVDKYQSVAFDPLVTFLAGATRPGIQIDARHSTSILGPSANKGLTSKTEAQL